MCSFSRSLLEARTACGKAIPRRCRSGAARPGLSESRLGNFLNGWGLKTALNSGIVLQSHRTSYSVPESSVFGSSGYLGHEIPTRKYRCTVPAADFRGALTGCVRSTSRLVLSPSDLRNFRTTSKAAGITSPLRNPLIQQEDLTAG